MKTLTLAGLMTLSAIAGSAITLSLSQVSFAQESQNDNRHWTQQHPAGQAHAQQQAAQLQAYANKQHFTEYTLVAANSRDELQTAVTNAMGDGWKPQGGVGAIGGSLGSKALYQAMVR